MEKRITEAENSCKSSQISPLQEGWIFLRFQFVVFPRQFFRMYDADDDLLLTIIIIINNLVSQLANGLFPTKIMLLV